MTKNKLKLSKETVVVLMAHSIAGNATPSGKCDSLYSCPGGHCPVEK